MSHQLNQVVTTWEIVESTIRRSCPIRKGRKLNKLQSIIWKDALFLLYLCWYDMLSLSGDVSERLATEWVRTLTEVDAHELTAILKEADNMLIDSVYDTAFQEYDDFKHRLAAKFPSAGRVIGPTKRVLSRWFCDRTTEAFKSLHCMFSFVSRVSLPKLQDLQEEALSAYLENDERLPEDGFTMDEESIITSWFPRDCRFKFFENFEPRHGDGSVADAKSHLAAKYRAIGVDNRLRYLLNKCEDRCLPFVRDDFDRIAKVIFVAKTVSKLRTICMEPATLQWAQHGFGDQIARYFTRHPYLSKRLDLEAAWKNADLAWQGSLDGQLATIDLSAASDSVSSALVKAWFAHSGLREILWCCRSDRALLPNKLLMSPKKYAPMGSNLCFPVECIVFAAMCEATITEQGGSPRYSQYRVYGDDIVIETKYASALIQRLEHNGFIVNKEKSFSQVGPMNFRESCGGEYLDGVDVTPVRISRKFDGLGITPETPERIVRLTTFANECNYSLPSVRRYLIRLLNKLPIEYRVPFDNSGEGRLFSPQPTNFHLGEPVWHEDYQSWAYTYGQSVSSTDRPVLDEEEIRLYEYFRVADKRTRLMFPEDLVSVTVRPPRETKWRSVTDTHLGIG